MADYNLPSIGEVNWGPKLNESIQAVKDIADEALAHAGSSGAGGPITADKITDSSPLGRSVLKADTQSTAITAIGAATAAQGAKADTALQPGSLAAVATSGSYTDLSNKPTIPATAADVGAVSATGDQTVAGVKTYASIPVLPGTDPTAANEAARKSYVDTKSAASASAALVSYGATVTIRWDSTSSSWPSRTVPAGYTGIVIWDSAADITATAPANSLPGDRWLKRVTA